MRRVSDYFRQHSWGSPASSGQVLWGLSDCSGLHVKGFPSSFGCTCANFYKIVLSISRCSREESHLIPESLEAEEKKGKEKRILGTGLGTWHLALGT